MIKKEVLKNNLSNKVNNSKFIGFTFNKNDCEGYKVYYNTL